MLESLLLTGTRRVLAVFCEEHPLCISSMPLDFEVLRGRVCHSVLLTLSQGKVLYDLIRGLAGIAHANCFDAIFAQSDLRS